jgi:hypothetical protein
LDLAKVKDVPRRLVLLSKPPDCTHSRCASLREISGIKSVFFDGCLLPATIVDNDSQETTQGTDHVLYSLAGRIQIEQHLDARSKDEREAIAALRPRPAATEAVAVDANGVAKVLEMFSTVPQWFLASLAGNLPFWLATRTLAGQLWWPTLESPDVFHGVS